jgi:hypothetical protein
MLMKNSNDNIENRTRDLPACSAVLQPTAPLSYLYSNYPESTSTYDWIFQIWDDWNKRKIVGYCVCDLEMTRNVKFYYNSTVSCDCCSSPLYWLITLKVTRVRGPGSVAGYSNWLPTGRSGNRIPVGGEIFRTFSDRPWGPPSLLHNGYRVFPEGKERPRRDADHSPVLVPLVMKE